MNWRTQLQNFILLLALCVGLSNVNLVLAVENHLNGAPYVQSFFDGQSPAPFFSCTTQKPNYLKTIKNDFVGAGVSALKLQWHQRSWNGTRMTKGVEACSSLKVQKEGWYGFSLYLPDPGYPRDKDAAVMQIFQLGRCNSWAATLDIKSNDLYFSHRSSCGKPTVQLIAVDVPRNTWIRIVIHFKVSGKNNGFIKLWYRDVVEDKPDYVANNINFGFGLWGLDDTLIDENPLVFKFGQYNYDSLGYSPNEIRIIYYDSVTQIIGNPLGAWSLLSKSNEVVKH